MILAAALRKLLAGWALTGRLKGTIVRPDRSDRPVAPTGRMKRLHVPIVGPTRRPTQATYYWSVKPVGPTGRTDCSLTTHICQSNQCSPELTMGQWVMAQQIWVGHGSENTNINQSLKWQYAQIRNHILTIWQDLVGRQSWQGHLSMVMAKWELALWVLVYYLAKPLHHTICRNAFLGKSHWESDIC